MDFTRNAMAAPTQIGKAFGLAGGEARAKRDEGGIRIGQKKIDGVDSWDNKTRRGPRAGRRAGKFKAGEGGPSVAPRLAPPLDLEASQ
jgi:hypothetical protein